MSAVAAVSHALWLAGWVKLDKPVQCSRCRRWKRWGSVLQDARLASRGWFPCRRRGCRGAMCEVSR